MHLNQGFLFRLVEGTEIQQSVEEAGVWLQESDVGSCRPLADVHVFIYTQIPYVYLFIFLIFGVYFRLVGSYIYYLSVGYISQQQINKLIRLLRFKNEMFLSL